MFVFVYRHIHINKIIFGSSRAILYSELFNVSRTKVDLKVDLKKLKVTYIIKKEVNFSKNVRIRKGGNKTEIREGVRRSKK